jgi:hypothetical protein
MEVLENVDKELGGDASHGTEDSSDGDEGQTLIACPLGRGEDESIWAVLGSEFDGLVGLVVVVVGQGARGRITVLVDHRRDGGSESRIQGPSARVAKLLYFTLM